MSKVLFLKSKTFRKLPLSPKRLHTIEIRFSNLRRAKHHRWQVQEAVQNAGSFKAIRGLKDALALSGGLHVFKARTGLVPRFVNEIRDLVEDGSVEVCIDGREMKLRPQASASG